MAIEVGDPLSILTGGNGHSGGEIPSSTEVMTRGQWTGTEDVKGQLVHYGVQIDISDLSTDTDANEGLYAGFFRWVTERPNYDGVTVVPTGDNEGDVWKEGIVISRDNISPVDRIIDVNRAGDYGSLSGFNLAIDNTSDYGAAVLGFDDYIRQNGYELINRPIKFYIIIDDVFYQVWGGVIAEIKYTEKVFQFICKDVFERVHKPMPPNQIVKQKFPGADPDNVGKSVPIIFGDVLRAELINITGKSEPLEIGYSDLTASVVDITAATNYDVDGVTNQPFLEIKTPNFSFEENYFIDNGTFYITVFKGDSQGLLIVGNDATDSPGTSGATTKIYLGRKLTETVENFNLNNAYSGTPISETVWFFRIYKFSVAYLASDKEIDSFVQDSLNSLDLYRWNADRLRYDQVPELLETFDESENNIYDSPFVALVNNDIDIEGDFVRLIPIFPKSILFESKTFIKDNSTSVTPDTDTIGVDNDLLLDKDRTTYQEAALDPGSAFSDIIISNIVNFPDNFVYEDLDEMFICFDINIDTTGVVGDTRLKWTIEVQDQFEQSNFAPDEFDYILITGDLRFNTLPNLYYKQGNDGGFDSDFEKELFGTFVSETVKLDPNLVSNFNEALVSGKIKLTISILSSINNIQGVQISQIGFFGSQKLNTIKDKIFVKTKGELEQGDPTDNVYQCIRHILEGYDEIPNAEVDYGNLELYSTRDNWRTGRQVKKRQLSSKYLKELAAQSFVGIYPDRYGRRHTKSFLDDLSTIWTHADDNGTIIKNSLSKFEATPINELFNDFKIDYDWNPGLGQFNETIFVTNTDARTEADPYNASFPSENESTGIDQDFSAPADLTSVTIEADETNGNAQMTASPSWAEVGGAISFDDGSGNKFSYARITSIVSNQVYFTMQNQGEIGAGTYTTGSLTDHGTNVKKWTTWVGGVNDYENAKGYWEICYRSWLKTQTVNKLPADLGSCRWYINGAAFDGTGTQNDASAAHLFLANLTSWTTRQKFRALYSIPISKNNIQIDLLDYVSFKDQKYTNGEFYTGYVEKIKIDPTRDRIDLEVILKPPDLETFPPDTDLIIETGNAPDTITELGNNPNTITEIGV